MTAGERLHAAIVAALKDEPLLGPALTRVFDAVPVRAARPYAVVDDPMLSDWGAKDIPGREGRIAVLLYDLGERPTRLRMLSGLAEDAVEACPRDLGEGWRLVTCRLIRSRVLRQDDGRWTSMAEFRARMLQFN